MTNVKTTLASMKKIENTKPSGVRFSVNHFLLIYVKVKFGGFEMETFFEGRGKNFYRSSCNLSKTGSFCSTNDRCVAWTGLDLPYDPQAGSLTTNVRQPISFGGRVFNFKSGCF
jgi:hypothetical protein